MYSHWHGFVSFDRLAMICIPAWRENSPLPDPVFCFLIVALMPAESFAEILRNCLRAWSVNLHTMILRNRAGERNPGWGIGQELVFTVLKPQNRRSREAFGPLIIKQPTFVCQNVFETLSPAHQPDSLKSWYASLQTETHCEGGQNQIYEIDR